MLHTYKVQFPASYLKNIISSTKSQNFITSIIAKSYKHILPSQIFQGTQLQNHINSFDDDITLHSDHYLTTFLIQVITNAY